MRALDFSPDGGTLAVGDERGLDHRTWTHRLRTHASRVGTTDRTPSTAEVAFAPDGRTFATGEASPGATTRPTEVLVLAQRPSTAAILRWSRAISAGRLVGFTGGGRFLFVTSGETTISIARRTDVQARPQLPVSGSAASSPDG